MTHQLQTLSYRYPTSYAMLTTHTRFETRVTEGPVARKEPGKIGRIAADLRAKIESGKLPPGSRLPSVSELQAAEGIAFQTARDVHRVLEREGLTFTQQGKGSFVTPFLGKITRDGTGRYQAAARSEGGARGAFEAELNRLGLVYKRTPTEIGRARPPKDVATALGLHHSSKAIYRHRAMKAGRDSTDPTEGFVVQLATSYFPIDVAGGSPIEDQDTGPGGSKSRLADLGFTQRHVRETIEARFPTQEEAEALSIPEDRQVYELVHHASTAEGRVIEVARHIMPSTIWRFAYTWDLDA
ncbi:MAG TPA: GntR family transcriptional regulator [Streptomyces sp.]|uniref:GntR family transcriptional regulator n=1 Tax=Streptomyces sp. TaxID=1931 RepID=UPI002D0126F2|nr:GntR family transcriptional regulator [Streptomyces sp.]HWU08039.1 GntR family transcriptional regulator [Streptomyces sp.]